MADLTFAMKSSRRGGRTQVHRGVQRNRISGGNRGQFGFPAQGLETFQICPDLMLAVEAVVIVGPQVAVWDIVLEHMPDHCEDGMGYSDGGTIFAPPGGNALILCVKI